MAENTSGSPFKNICATNNEVKWCKRPGYPLTGSPLRITCDTEDVILCSKRWDR